MVAARLAKNPFVDVAFIAILFVLKKLVDVPFVIVAFVAFSVAISALVGVFSYMNSQAENSNKAIQSLNDKFTELGFITKYIDGINLTLTDINMINQEIDESKNILKCEDRINRILDYSNALDEHKKECELIESIIHHANTYNEEIRRHNLNINELEKKYDEELKSLGICPWCGRSLR